MNFEKCYMYLDSRCRIQEQMLCPNPQLRQRKCQDAQLGYSSMNLPACPVTRGGGVVRYLVLCKAAEIAEL